MWTLGGKCRKLVVCDVVRYLVSPLSIKTYCRKACLSPPAAVLTSSRGSKTGRPRVEAKIETGERKPFKQMEFSTFSVDGNKKKSSARTPCAIYYRCISARWRDGTIARGVVSAGTHPGGRMDEQAGVRASWRRTGRRAGTLTGGWQWASRYGSRHCATIFPRAGQPASRLRFAPLLRDGSSGAQQRPEWRTEGRHTVQD